MSSDLRFDFLQHFAVVGPHFGQFWRRGNFPGQDILDHPQQFLDPYRFAGRHGDDRNAQRSGQHFGLDDDAFLRSDIHHIEGYHHRRGERNQFGDQVQAAFQVGRADHRHHHLWTVADDKLARHHFLGRVGGQGVSSR